MTWGEARPGTPVWVIHPYDRARDAEEQRRYGARGAPFMPARRMGVVIGRGVHSAEAAITRGDYDIGMVGKVTVDYGGGVHEYCDPSWLEPRP